MADDISKSIEERVQDGARAFADFEAEVAAFKRFDFRGLFKAVHDAGMVGYLEYQQEAAGMEAMISAIEAEVFAKHRALTIRAQELGIDLPAPRDSGGGR